LQEIEPLFVRSDVYAQLLRLRLMGEAIGALALDGLAAAHEAEKTAGFQIVRGDSGGDPRVSGGFLFGRKQGKDLPFANPVSTAFGLQTLAFWNDWTAGTRNADYRDLI
jgi:hypothetical protein